MVVVVVVEGFCDDRKVVAIAAVVVVVAAVVVVVAVAIVVVVVVMVVVITTAVFDVIIHQTSRMHVATRSRLYIHRGIQISVMIAGGICIVFILKGGRLFGFFP